MSRITIYVLSSHCHYDYCKLNTNQTSPTWWMSPQSRHRKKKKSKTFATQKHATIKQRKQLIIITIKHKHTSPVMNAFHKPGTHKSWHSFLFLFFFNCFSLCLFLSFSVAWTDSIEPHWFHLLLRMPASPTIHHFPLHPFDFHFHFHSCPTFYSYFDFAVVLVHIHVIPLLPPTPSLLLIHLHLHWSCLFLIFFLFLAIWRYSHTFLFFLLIFVTVSVSCVCVGSILQFMLLHVDYV